MAAWVKRVVTTVKPPSLLNCNNLLILLKFSFLWLLLVKIQIKFYQIYSYLYESNRTDSLWHCPQHLFLALLFLRSFFRLKQCTLQVGKTRICRKKFCQSCIRRLANNWILLLCGIIKCVCFIVHTLVWMCHQVTIVGRALLAVGYARVPVASGATSSLHPSPFR